MEKFNLLPVTFEYFSYADADIIQLECVTFTDNFGPFEKDKTYEYLVIDYTGEQALVSCGDLSTPVKLVPIN